MCGEKWLTFDDVTDFVGESNTEFKIELKTDHQQTKLFANYFRPKQSSFAFVRKLVLRKRPDQ